MKLLFLSFSVFFSLNLFALSVKDALKEEFGDVQYVKLPYMNKSTTMSLRRVYESFTKEDVKVTADSPFLERTINANPKIKNWGRIKKGEWFYLYLNFDHISEEKLFQYRPSLHKKFMAVKRRYEDKQNRPDGFKSSLFYMASYGMFNESNPDRADLDFYQNSPATIGFAGSYYPKETKYSFSSSLYISTLVAATNNVEDGDLSVPPEIGANIYGEYPFYNLGFVGYAGFDFEKFNSLNLEGLQEEEELLVDQNNVLYFTLGAARHFYIFDRTFFGKASFSRSIASTKELGYADSTDTQSFNGQKVMLYLSYKIKEKWFLHTLYKYHWMTGSSELTSQRLGVGFGYALD